MTLPISEQPTFTLVVNPEAGDGSAQRALPQVSATILNARPGASLRIYQPASAEEALAYCRAAVARARRPENGQARDALLVMGGDGNMHVGLNACAGTGVPMGIIPAGTGNDMARGLGIPTSPVAAAKTIAAGHVRTMDLMKLTGPLPHGDTERFVGTIMCSGFDAAVNAAADELTWPIGSGRYVRALFKQLRGFEPYRYRLTIDGEVRELDAMLVAVGNTAYYGGGIKICPQAVVDDGLLDVTIVHPVSKTTLVRLGPALYCGSFVSDPAVELIRARQVTIDGQRLQPRADGDPMGHVPLTASIAPNALDVLVPETVGV